MSDQSPYTAQAKARWRKHILAKGKGVSDKLATLLAGKEVRLESMPLQDKPGETKEERLRRYLDLLMATLRRLDEPEFGQCSKCSKYLTEWELNDMPWADMCTKCFRG